MFKKKDQSRLDERLDRIGREVVRASASNEAEAHAVAASPFLYTRLRAALIAERERREAAEGWLVSLKLMRRAVLAMSLVTFLALGVFWFAQPNSASLRSFNDEAFFDARNVGVQRVVFEDPDPLSNDEVLDTIMTEDREASK
jgi:hypothetical protein